MLKIPHEELEGCYLSFPHWGNLCNSSYGYIRHQISEDIPPKDVGLPASHDPHPDDPQDPKKGWEKFGRGLKKYKPIPEEHLQHLGMLDEIGIPKKRVILIGNRNLGNNPGFVAWHREKIPDFSTSKAIPYGKKVYSCFTYYRDGKLVIEHIRFKPEDGFLSLSGIRWAKTGR